VFRRRHFLSGQTANGHGLPDAAWFTAEGGPMTDADWNDPQRLSVGVFLNGDVVGRRTRHGERPPSASFYLCLHPHWQDATFLLPGPAYGGTWEVVLDTAADDAPPAAFAAGAAVPVLARSFVLLTRTSPPEGPS
jgi:glycogen operon protein